MLKRTISALVAFPLLIGMILLGGKVLDAGLLALILIGVYEVLKGFKAIKIKSIVMDLLTYMYVSLMYLSFINNIDINFNLFITFIFIIALLAINLFGKSNYLLSIGVHIFAIFYVGFLLFHIRMIYIYDSTFFIWYVFILAWGSDTCAYFVGRAFGNKKLMERVSPNKTIAGAVGGILGAGCIATIFAYYFNPDFVVYAFFLGLIGSIGSQMGDLIASRIKREIGIKDFGKIMPGHGGVIDRFDSILITAPLVYYFMIFYMKVLV